MPREWIGRPQRETPKHVKLFLREYHELTPKGMKYLEERVGDLLWMEIARPQRSRRLTLFTLLESAKKIAA